MKLKGIRKPTTPSPSTAARGTPRRPSDATAATIGILGWLVVLLGIGLLTNTMLHQRRQTARIRAVLQPGLNELQASLQPRQQALNHERDALTLKINELVKRQEDLLLQVRSAELAIQALEPQVKTLERTQGKLADTVGDLQTDQALAGEGIAGLQARLNGLERTCERLKDEYKMRFQAMRVGYDAAKDATDPEAMRRFYVSHRQTAFAPAAGYHAAEKLYAAKRSADALRLYKEVVRLFPGSVYVESCRGRVTQIEAGSKYSEPPAPVDFEPYLPEAAAATPASQPAATETPAEPGTP